MHAASPSLHVSGNQLRDAAGAAVQLRGVNRSGTEYACIQGWGIFDGPSDAASVQAIASWHVNAVRIPLNEDCWLGINGAPATYSGANYVNAIAAYTSLLNSYGIDAELSLMWAAPGTYQATSQPGAPDEDHAPAFWSSLAATFKADPGVILAPWGETTVDWGCFRDGGICEATYGASSTAYDTAGMKQAVTVMRQAGYAGPIAIPCIDYANDCADASGSWLTYKPSDPDNQLIAEAHVYGKNTCDTTSCFDATMASVTQQVPMIWGETGETYDASDCGSGYISTFLPWADAHGVGYLAWTWDTWGSCLALVADYTGTPLNAYAVWVQSHYAARAASNPIVTRPDPIGAFGLAAAAEASAPPSRRPAAPPAAAGIGGTASVVSVGEGQPVGSQVVEEHSLPAQQRVMQPGGHLRPPQVTGRRNRSALDESFDPAPHTVRNLSIAVQIAKLHVLHQLLERLEDSFILLATPPPFASANMLVVDGVACNIEGHVSALRCSVR